MMKWLVCSVGLCLLVLASTDTPEGCRKGWMYYQQMCYLYSPHSMDAVGAKEICNTYKHSSLASIWNDEESQFITNTLIPPGSIDMVWIGLVSKTNKEKEWAWLDGSIADIRSGAGTPESNDNLCGALSMDGKMVFRDCWQNLDEFVCKTSLEMTYIVSDLANTSESSNQPPKVLFERVWPPKLYDFPKYVMHIAHTKVSAVAHETDCAFYCAHVTDCKAFTIQCLLAWKCNQYSCEMYKSI